jgi:hypothetical protein
MSTIYSIRIHGARGPGDIGAWTTIIRYIPGDEPHTLFAVSYAGFGPTLRDQLCDARAKLKAALTAAKATQPEVSR